MAAAPVGRITVERDGSVASVTLDAPPVNAFSLARYIEITEVFTELAVDDDERQRIGLAAFDAAEALRIGLVEAVVPSVELAVAAADLAHRIAAKSPLGLRVGKQSLNAIEGLPVKDGYEIEQSFSAKLVQTRDSREALTAVVEKRAPRFEGR